jgi:hypothetical protein
VGLHNGRTLMRQADDEPWLYLKLEGDDDDDEDEAEILSHRSTKPVRLHNFFKHNFCAIVRTTS